MLAFINCWDVSWATKVQDIFTYAKLLALFIIIFTGAYQLFTGEYVGDSLHGRTPDRYVDEIQFHADDK